MRGCIVYFSATGNTEYVAKGIKEEFERKSIQCGLFEISKESNFKDEYDFYVFGAPIHAELFPEFYIEWVKKNITNGHGKNCIVFSTQASGYGYGPSAFSEILKDKGLKVIIEECIVMPNNYYIVMFRKFSEQKVLGCMKEVRVSAERIVDKFLKGEVTSKPSGARGLYAKPVFKLFMYWSKKWAKRNLSVDIEKCTKCGLCQKNCPVKNIIINEDNITFIDKCISCQRCIHNCPTNAFLYRNKKIDQYKLK